jgi:hypothetical protein
MSENGIDSENVSKPAPDTRSPRASARNPKAREEGGPGQEGDQQAKGGPHQQESRSDYPYRTPVRRLGVLAERSSFAVINLVALETSGSRSKNESPKQKPNRKPGNPRFRTPQWSATAVFWNKIARWKKPSERLTNSTSARPSWKIKII